MLLESFSDAFWRCFGGNLEALLRHFWMILEAFSDAFRVIF